MRRLLLALGVVLVLEGALRLGPERRWRAFTGFREQPMLSAPDGELGWVTRPGNHRWRTDTGTVTVGIDAHHARLPATEEASVAVFGGSFTFGFGLDDAQALHVPLAAALGVPVHNHAVPGYSTLQSWLAWQRTDCAPEQVVYGLVELHDARNAAAWSWLDGLERAATGQHWVALPAARWWGGEVVLLPPLGRRHWWLSEHSALVATVERSVIYLHDRLWLVEQSEATLALVERFHREVTSGGARFTVAVLHAPTRGDAVVRRLQAAGIDVLDARQADFAEHTLPDGHPDAEVQARWASQLARHLATPPASDRR